MRVKEAPAQALRAVFGGIGSLLSVGDKIRNKPAASETSASAESVTPETTTVTPETTTVTPETTTVTPETTTVTPETTTVTPETTTVTPETTTVTPESTTVTPETTTVTPETTTVTPETTTVTPETTTVTPEASALPLANYDALSVASLRARLRNLSVDQLGQLIDYEKAHADRAEVITMFERRITKLNLGLTQALPKVTE
jgi:hypothetical protein